MGHFAKVVNGIVTSVIAAEAEFFETFVDSSAGEWIRTSYNTRGNVYYTPGTTTPDPDQSKKLRGNYAGIGYHYNPDIVIDGINGVFYESQPYDSWVLNTETWLWEAPVPYPNDGNIYSWNETTKNWVEPV